MKNTISIRLLGMGDARYRRIKSNLTEVLPRLPYPTALEEIMDLETILLYNVSAVPAILVEDKVVFEQGDIPSVEQLEKLLKDAFSEQATI